MCHVNIANMARNMVTGHRDRSRTAAWANGQAKGRATRPKPAERDRHCKHRNTPPPKYCALDCIRDENRPEAPHRRVYDCHGGHNGHMTGVAAAVNPKGESIPGWRSQTPSSTSTETVLIQVEVPRPTERRTLLDLQHLCRRLTNPSKMHYGRTMISQPTTRPTKG